MSDQKPEDWSALKYFIPPKPDLSKIVVDVTQLRKENADLERQLSDTRRRLAEVVKEREEVRTALEQIKPMLKLGIGVFNRTVLKGGDAGCAHKENASHASSTLKSQGTRHNETTKTSASDAPGDVQSVTTGPDYTALRNAADGVLVALNDIYPMALAWAEYYAGIKGESAVVNTHKLTLQQAKDTTAAYAALISEGEGKPTSEKSEA